LPRRADRLGHTGELPGYNSFIGYDPDSKITVVVWASMAPTVDGNAPAVEMAKLVIGELYAPRRSTCPRPDLRAVARRGRTIECAAGLDPRGRRITSSCDVPDGSARKRWRHRIRR
jgi:hypothetical protein